MINKILVFPRHFVEKNIDLFNKHKIGIISIIDYPKDILLTNTFKDEKNISQIPEISVCFNDITKDDYDQFDEANKKAYILFNKKHAEYIINFVNIFKNEIDILIIHCEAGIARSGAVGYWACRYLELDLNLFMKLNLYILPNYFVYDILHKMSGLRIKNDLKELFHSDDVDVNNIF